MHKILVLILFVTCASSNSKVDLLPSKRDCAILSTKLIPGHYVLFDDYLFTVLLEYKKNGTSTGHHCGGAVINKNYILTAAHCVTGNIISKYGHPYKVRFNEYDRKFEKNSDAMFQVEPPNDSTIQEIIPHFGYNSSNFNEYNDIALIRFTEKPDYIEPVCFEYHQVLDNDRVKLWRNRFSVIGWSITEDDNGRTDKRQGFMETISNEECAKYVNITLIDSQFCAIKRLSSSTHDKRSDESCYGDSGGAILRNGNNIDYYISGIDSIRFTKCDNRFAPIVYTNVTKFLPWILDNLKP